MKKNTTEILKKTLKEFHCVKCDYVCSRKSDFNKHLKSKKHNTTNTTKIQQKILHSCECGKSYNHRASLFNHKKACTYKKQNIESESTDKNVGKEAVIEILLKENREMKEAMIDLCKKIEPNLYKPINDLGTFSLVCFEPLLFMC